MQANIRVSSLNFVFDSRLQRTKLGSAQSLTFSPEVRNTTKGGGSVAYLATPCFNMSALTIYLDHADTALSLYQLSTKRGRSYSKYAFFYPRRQQQMAPHSVYVFSNRGLPGLYLEKKSG